VLLLYAPPGETLCWCRMNPSPGSAEPVGAAGRLFFERELRPHRSLPRQRFHVLMLVLGLVSLALGTGFVVAGAWPVFGFFGLDVGLVYVAFRHNYRGARGRETLRLADDAFTVERIGRGGETRLWRFQPFWLRVVLEERPDRSNQLLVASHGRSLVIADFLAPAARRELAATIADGLAAWRNALNPALASDTPC